MEKKILLVVLVGLVVLGGCTDYDEPTPYCASCEDLGEVFVKVNYELPLTSEVRCSALDFPGEYELTFEHTWIYVLDYRTDVLEDKGYIYRVRSMNLERGYENLYNKQEFQSYLNNSEYSEIWCRGYFLPANSISVERWDEGYKESENIFVFTKYDLECYKLEGWECRIEFDGSTRDCDEYGCIDFYWVEEIFNDMLWGAIE